MRVLLYIVVELLFWRYTKGREVTILHFSVVEEQHLPFSIGELNITDTEGVTFRMIPEGKSESYIYVDPNSGVLWLRQRIDREQICPNQEACHIDFGVLSRKMDSHEVYKIQISVLDINDHSPCFRSKSTRIPVSEASKVGTTIVLPEAEDLDTGENGVQYYNISGDLSPFVIHHPGPKDEGSFILKTRVTLDRETISSYKLILMAFDGGRKNGSTVINIEILDVNDNEPIFDNGSYIIHITEGAKPIRAIMTLQATDEDVGLNGFINYEFSQKNNAQIKEMFSLDSSSGEIYVNNVLDRELQDKYNLIVIAKDSGVIPLSSSVKVTVYVIDVNDNAPKIQIHPFSSDHTLSILENKPIGSPLGTISVDDYDFGRNGEVNCSLDSSVFSLKHLFGNKLELVTNKILDREYIAMYNVTIVCKDHGLHPLTTEMTRPVIILDVNDNPPRFSQQVYHIHIVENNKIDASVYQVNVLDADSDNSATYTSMSDYSDKFYIDHDGILSALDSFDREEKSLYTFNITVKDKDFSSPNVSSSAKVVVNILDQNDNKPRFNKDTYTFRTFENHPVGSQIGVLEAEDSDLSPNNIFKYSFYSNGKLIPFRIDKNTGVITATKVFDRELKDSYHLTAVVRDPMKPSFYSQTMVNIIIDDTNDNVPIFLFPTPNNNTIKVHRNISTGTVIGKISASDADVGFNGLLTYSCELDPNFIVNSKTGEIKLQSYPQQEGILILKVIAKDGTESQYRHTIKANVYVIWQPKNEMRVSKAESENWKSGSETKTSDFLNFTVMIVVTVVALIVIVFLAILIVVLRRQQMAEERRKQLSSRRVQERLTNTAEEEENLQAVDYEIVTEMDACQRVYSPVNINKDEETKFVTTKYFAPPMNNCPDFLDVCSEGSDSAVHDLSLSSEEPFKTSNKNKLRNDHRSSAVSTLTCKTRNFIKPLEFLSLVNVSPFSRVISFISGPH